MTDAEMISTPSRWPMWPILPLQKRGATMDSDGFITAGDLTTVVHGNVYAIGEMTEEQIKQLTRTKYPSAEQLLKDWRID